MNTMRTGQVMKLTGALLLAGIAGTIYCILKKKVGRNAWVVVEVQIPAKYAGWIIGRKGANIKAIQAKTDTKISFQDPHDADEEQQQEQQRVCVIQGRTSSNTSAARLLVLQCVESCKRDQQTSHMLVVPSRLVGRILGAAGRHVKDITRKTGVRIDVESRDAAGDAETRRIELRGTAEGVAAAMQIITDKVEQLQKNEVLFRSTSGGNARHRHGGRELGGPGAALLDVHVSCVVSATRLYVQVLGSCKLSKLSALVATMTELYTDVVERKAVSVAAVVGVGDVVAAVLPLDKQWYRARVLEVLPPKGEKVGDDESQRRAEEENYWSKEGQKVSKESNVRQQRLKDGPGISVGALGPQLEELQQPHYKVKAVEEFGTTQASNKFKDISSVCDENHVTSFTNGHIHVTSNDCTSIIQNGVNNGNNAPLGDNSSNSNLNCDNSCAKDNVNDSYYNKDDTLLETNQSKGDNGVDVYSSSVTNACDFDGCAARACAFDGLTVNSIGSIDDSTTVNDTNASIDTAITNGCVVMDGTNIYSTGDLENGGTECYTNSDITPSETSPYSTSYETSGGVDVTLTVTVSESPRPPPHSPIHSITFSVAENSPRSFSSRDVGPPGSTPQYNPASSDSGDSTTSSESSALPPYYNSIANKSTDPISPSISPSLSACYVDYSYEAALNSNYTGSAKTRCNDGVEEAPNCSSGVEGGLRYRVFYVDYGDEAVVDAEDVCVLRTDFLRLGFQAMLVQLAGVRESSGGDVTEAAALALAELSHEAKWRPLVAEVVGYHQADGSDSGASLSGGSGVYGGVTTSSSGGGIPARVRVGPITPEETLQEDPWEEEPQQQQQQQQQLEQQQHASVQPEVTQIEKNHQPTASEFNEEKHTDGALTEDSVYVMNNVNDIKDKLHVTNNLHGVVDDVHGITNDLYDVTNDLHGVPNDQDSVTNDVHGATGNLQELFAKLRTVLTEGSCDRSSGGGWGASDGSGEKMSLPLTEDFLFNYSVVEGSAHLREAGQALLLLEERLDALNKLQRFTAGQKREITSLEQEIRELKTNRSKLCLEDQKMGDRENGEVENANCQGGEIREHELEKINSEVDIEISTKEDLTSKRNETVGKKIERNPEANGISNGQEHELTDKQILTVEASEPPMKEVRITPQEVDAAQFSRESTELIVKISRLKAKQRLLALIQRQCGDDVRRQSEHLASGSARPPAGEIWSPTSSEVVGQSPGEIERPSRSLSANGSSSKLTTDMNQLASASGAMPLVRLFDCSGNKVVDIAAELVDRGLLLWS